MLKLAAFATATAIAAVASSHSSLFTSAPLVSPVAPMLVADAEPDLVLRGSLARAGLAPEELVAAGVPTAEVAALVGRAKAHDVVRSNRIAGAMQSLGEAQQRVASLERAIRGGDRADSTIGALSTARTDADTAKAGLRQQLDALFAEATRGLPQDVTQRLRQIQANAAHRRMPIEFLVADRSPAEWADLRDCLTHERVCTRRGDETDPTLMAALAAARAQSDVAGAKARCSANLAAAEAAWLNASTL